MKQCCLFALFLLLSQISAEASRPNVVFILGDDLGWADVPWNNPRLRTLMPELDSLAKKSRLLTQAYALPVCTPSRAALLTGIYPFRYGLQRGYGEAAPSGLPTSIKILPQYLRDKGYSTHMVGKWHLGHCDTRYTPTERGFDTFIGSYSGAIDHWNRRGGANSWIGYDLRNGSHLSEYGRGLYSSELEAKRAKEVIRDSSRETKPYFLYVASTMVHAPFQDPTIRGSGKDSPNPGVRTAMLTAFDTLIGRVISAVQDSKKDTIVIFMSDNGGNRYPDIEPNLPLRGEKGEVYEGGTRVPALIYHPSDLRPGEYDGLFHMVDWLPTILSRVAATVAGVDGVDQNLAIWQKAEFPRTDIIYNMDEGGSPGHNGLETERWQSAVRRGRYKLVWGAPSMLKKEDSPWDKDNDPVLEMFDLESDPNEEHNLARSPQYASKLAELKQWVSDISIQMVPVNSSPVSKAGKPSKNEGNIVSGWCLAVHKNYCTLDKHLLRVFGRGRIHLYTKFKAFLYNSPLAPETDKLCIVEPADEILSS